ncbi:MAG TPA: prenyltransferase/squalene oxidase repeat-containing protein [Humisphaera sp.]
MRHPRAAIAVVAVVVACAVAAPTARAADRPAKLDDAVDRALGYLARQQRPDGFFDHERKPEGKDADASGHRRAITGLCTLAFLSAGHVPDAGKHGKVVRSAVDALTNAVPDDGYVGKLDEKPMYTQAIVTLALSQAVGAEPLADRRTRQQAALKRLVKVIVEAQAVRKDAPHVGGWRYTREAPDSDLSLSGWNALALRGAADAGVDVPPEAIKRAVYYVAGCYVADKKGFAYQPGGDLQAGTTATGALCLYLLDRGVRVEARDAAGTLASRPLDEKGTGGYPFYATFYVVQASAQAGDEVWKAAGLLALDRLIKAQEQDGAWPKEWPFAGQEPGRVYRAAMATLALTVPYRVLPVYQR